MKSTKNNNLTACPVADSNDYTTYPGIDEEMYSDMYFDITTIAERDLAYFFSYICRNENGDIYISVYVWDGKYSLETPKRFIIREGYRMTDEDEDEFLGYLRHGIQCGSPLHYTSFIRLVRLVFPELHLPPEKEDCHELMLEHIYYAGHASGAKEILYKAGLDSVAFHLERYPSYNPEGTTPAKIIGRGTTLKMLRIIESAGLVFYLFTNKSTESFVSAYRMCSDYLNSKKVTSNQISYLITLCSHGKEHFEKEFNSDLYKHLGTDEGFLYLKPFMDFEELRVELQGIVDVEMPQFNNLCEVVEDMKRLRTYLPRKAYVDKQIAARTEACCLGYSAISYSVILPRSVMDFFNEAVSQHNCVMDFIGPYINGDTTIVFLRRTDDPEKSYVTIEIKNNKIKQVYAKANRLPEPEVYQFLEIYSEAMGLRYDPYRLIEYSLDDCDDLPYGERLEEYAHNYKAQKDPGYFETQIETNKPDRQITFEEAFPELFEVA